MLHGNCYRFVHMALTAAMLVGFVTPGIRAEDPPFAMSSFTVHSPLPLGSQSVLVHPANRTFMLFASVENESFDGLTVTHRPRLRGSVQRADGTLLTHYPNTLDFRVTATALIEGLQLGDRDEIRDNTDLHDLLLKLRFLLKVHRGLDTEALNPEQVRLIGAPPDEPFEERVYRVSFNTGAVPVDARCVLEVFSPGGARLARFHLELL